MKAYLALISAAALSLAACSQQETAQPAAPASQASAAATASAPAETASATASSATNSAASAAQPAEVAAECSTVVESNDQMKYNVSQIDIKKSCTSFKIVLKHTGQMPKTSMGHNLVISKADDASSVASEGTGEGASKDFLKVSDSRIVAHTKMLGGGEEDSIVLDTSKLDPNSQYKFFCTFPAHFSMMQGDVKLVD